MDEGYIKFNVRLTEDDLPDYPGLDRINEVRTELHDLGLVNMYPNGIGYGNVSIRIGDSEKFLISGTATGDKRVLAPEDYSRVDAVDLDRNEVFCTGRARASSESMSHAAVYWARTDVNCVIHVHSIELFRFMLENNYPATPPEAQFGTPAMARAIQELAANSSAPSGIFVMAGHEEGVIAFGPTIAETRELLMDVSALIA